MAIGYLGECKLYCIFLCDAARTHICMYLDYWHIRINISIILCHTPFLRDPICIIIFYVLLFVVYRQVRIYRPQLHSTIPQNCLPRFQLATYDVCAPSVWILGEVDAIRWCQWLRNIQQYDLMMPCLCLSSCCWPVYTKNRLIIVLFLW